MSREKRFTGRLNMRVPDDFMDRVHEHAEMMGMTASNFIRMAVIQAMAVDRIMANGGNTDDIDKYLEKDLDIEINA